MQDIRMTLAEIKPESIEFTDLDNSVSFVDDGNSLLTSTTPLYTLISLDWYTAELVIQDNDGETFTLTIDDLDLEEESKLEKAKAHIIEGQTQ